MKKIVKFCENSDELYEFIREKIEENGLSVYRLSEMCGYSYNWFKTLRDNYKKGNKWDLFALEKVLWVLGYRVKIDMECNRRITECELKEFYKTLDIIRFARNISIKQLEIMTGLTRGVLSRRVEAIRTEADQLCLSDEFVESIMAGLKIAYKYRIEER